MKVYFYCVQPESHNNAAYHHSAICIAEGLKELGVEFYANVNYWQQSPKEGDYLFQHDPNVTPDNCSVVVVSLPWFLRGQPFPQELFHPQRTYKVVYIDREDGLKTFSWEPEFRQFDLILKTHYCKDAKYPDNVQPWAFGLSNRILDASQQSYKPAEKRTRKVLFNFRMKRNAHTLRKAIYKQFLPAIETVIPADTTTDQLMDVPSEPMAHLLWYQTGKRHYAQYYERLGSTQACACFGGYFVSPWPRDRSLYISRLQERIIAKLGLTTRQIVQWDSWRLWESLVAGCTTFHVDFEAYGFLLPVMPTNWQHYIGIDLKAIDRTVAALGKDPDILERIAEQGRAWALEHYSPQPTARRFLDLVSKLPPKASTDRASEVI